MVEDDSTQSEAISKTHFAKIFRTLEIVERNRSAQEVDHRFEVPDEALLDFANAIVESLREDPSCGQLEYKIGYCNASLMRWVCRLGFPQVVLEAVYEAYPESIRTPELDGTLPLHWACRMAYNPLETIQYLIGLYPEASYIGDKTDRIPLYWLLWRAGDYFKFVVKYFPEDILTPMLWRGNLAWRYPAPFPLDVLSKMIVLYDLQSIVVSSVASTSGFIRALVVKEGAHLKVEVESDSTFPYIVQQLLSLSIPLDSIEVICGSLLTTRCIVETLRGANQEPRSIEQGDALAEHMLARGSGCQPPPTPPLDLSTIERVSMHVDLSMPLTPQEPQTLMVQLLSRLAKLPNLKVLDLDGFQEYGADRPTREWFEGFSAFTHSLEHIGLRNFDSFATPAVCALIKQSAVLKAVTLMPTYAIISEHDAIEIASALRLTTSVQKLKLSSMEVGSEVHIANALKDSNSSLFEFDCRDSRGNYDSIHFYCTMNSVLPRLRYHNLSREMVIQVFIPYLGDMSVVYSMLRFRPDLWCSTTS